MVRDEVGVKTDNWVPVFVVHVLVGFFGRPSEVFAGICVVVVGVVR